MVELIYTDREHTSLFLGHGMHNYTPTLHNIFIGRIMVIKLKQIIIYSLGMILMVLEITLISGITIIQKF